MALRLRLITEASDLYSFEREWTELAAQVGKERIFSGPRWLGAWWRAYQRQLAGELCTVVAYDGEEMVALAPLYTRNARRSPGLKVREVRMLGDAGPRPPALDVLARPGSEELFGNALAEFLSAELEWDVLDLQPMREPSPTRAYLTNRLSALGSAVDTGKAGGARRLQLRTADVDLTSGSEPDELHRTYAADGAQLRKGLAALRRLSRLEWAHREEASPLVDREATHLLEDVVIPLGVAGSARLSRRDDPDGEARAAALVVDDGGRAVLLALAVDPEFSEFAARLIGAEARAAAERGLESLDVCTGAGEYDLPALPWSRVRSIRVRAYGQSPGAALARTYGAVRRSVEVAKDAPGAAAAGARAAWTKIRTAAAHVAGYERMHLYRGELWVRGLKPQPGLELQLFTAEDFAALDRRDREILIESLEIDERAWHENWERGDVAVLAMLNGRPAGVGWSAKGVVPVPELNRTISLLPGEAYIHDLFVAPQARGRSVAPSMLEFLATELRRRDVYRSWALIATDNIASIRAFEKAAYAAVADIIYARMAAKGKVVVRPPDPEAKQLFGLP